MRLIWLAVTSVAISLAAVGCGGMPEDTGDGMDSVDQQAAQRAPAPVSAPAAAGRSKVTICHIPPGNPANAHTITVGAPAVRAHLAHGDTMGACGSGGGGGGGGGGGSCGAVGTACTGSSSCCAGLSCVDTAGAACSGGACSCEVIIN